MSQDEGTLTTFGGRHASRQPPETSPFLFLVLECDRPLAPSMRCSLNGLDEVVLGRGDGRSAFLETRNELSTLRVSVADRRMSSEHARFERAAGRWVVLDRSKNGTFINGERIKRQVLSDGDLIEVGHTLLLFRAALACAATDPPIVDAADLDSDVPSWRTLSPELAAELARLRQVATSTVPVLIAGESGTGKELIARGVHTLSGRKGPFLAVNCGALPETLVESELFGYRKGAFSGAVQDRAGVFRDAHGGTLLLDEIGDLSPSSQAALLRVLQEREVVPVGGSTAIPVDVRIAAASHRDLEAMVETGEFREDLLARLAGFRFELPPLRERREDLGLLVAALLARHVSPETPAPALTVEAGRALVSATWPRNVRELEQGLSAAIALAGVGPIGVDHLPDTLFQSAEPDAELSDEDRELRAALIEALREHKGNITAAAQALGKARQQVQRWMKRFDLRASRYRG